MANLIAAMVAYDAMTVACMVFKPFHYVRIWAHLISCICVVHSMHSCGIYGV